MDFVLALQRHLPFSTGARLASEFLIPPHHSERLTDLSRDHSRSSALICNELRSKTTLVVSGKVQRSFRGIRNSEPADLTAPQH